MCQEIFSTWISNGFLFSKEQLNICFMQTPSGEIRVIKGLDVTVSDLVKTHGHHTLEAVKKVTSN